MIVETEICPTCERSHPITHLKCDNCGSLHEIEGFDGIIVHFSEEELDDDDLPVEAIDEDDIIYLGEFHFCQGRCITEYIMGNPKSFSPYDDRGVIMIVGAKDINWFFYALGRCDYD